MLLLPILENLWHIDSSITQVGLPLDENLLEADTRFFAQWIHSALPRLKRKILIKEESLDYIECYKAQNVFAKRKFSNKLL